MEFTTRAALREEPPGKYIDSAWVWHPQSLDVDGLLKSYGTRIGEGVLWLGHCIFTQLTEDARCRESGEVPLRAEYLRNVIGRHHLDAVREAARNIGYIHRNLSYCAGTRSQLYSVLSPYDQARLVRRPITDAGLRHNAATWREGRRRATWARIDCGQTPVHPAVCHFLWENLRKVRIDADFRYTTPQPACQVAAERLSDGDLWFVVDDFGRIHTNLTSLPRILRPHLSVDGERLATVDISEAQPLFIAITSVNSKLNKAPEGGLNLLPTGDPQPPPPPPPPPYDGRANMMDNHPYFVGTLDCERLPNDVRRYVELCESRALYQTVADRLGKTRDAAKKAILTAFFGKPWHQNAASAVLEELFPTVMADLRELKRGDHRRLAHLAQRTEGAFMFGRVVPRLMERGRDLFVSTIHDAVLTTVGNADALRKVMLDEFASLGVSPQVKVEPCSPLDSEPHGLQETLAAYASAGEKKTMGASSWADRRATDL